MPHRSSHTSPALRVYILALVLRLFNAVLSRAFFQPDEYWQALEPAHRWVWGFGWATWEWRVQPRDGAQDASSWRELVLQGGRGGIRSPLAVLPTAVAYAVLKLMGCESPAILSLAPRLVQACIADTTDLAVSRLATRILGPAFANAALFVSLSSFFNLHTATRTLSNSTETALTAWAWVYWPWEWLEGREPQAVAGAEVEEGDDEEMSSSLPLALGFAALATIMRPSNAVIWLFLGGHLFLRSGARRRLAMMRTAALVSLLAALSSFALDSTFYRTPTFTPLRFLHVNVLQSISLFYGANSPHFYLSQGIPLLLGTQLPFFLDGVAQLSRRSAALPVRSRAALESLLCASAGTVAVYSLLSHKEWRFLHPLLPAMHLLVALSLVQRSSTAPPPSTPPSPASRFARTTLRTRPSHALLLLAAVPPAVYLTAFHGLGQARVPAHIHAAEPRTRSVAYLMPCHSTAWQAGMHAPWLERAEGDEGDRAWFLTCEPPVLGQDPLTYLDQSDHFYLSPCTYLSTRFPPRVDPSFPPPPPPEPRPAASGPDLGWRHSWPERVVLFSSLLDVACDAGGRGEVAAEGTVGDVLTERGYVEERRLWNTLGGWHEDERRKGDVRVLVWREAEQGGGKVLEGERRASEPPERRGGVVGGREEL
ncbi:Alg9-like mannosyltransferase family-domain-containing protein [Rhodotorula diobovata]|uniref:Mannosyltransferase n=1 Tax=Rhodotorula diobovata TaxID=5288 RepID=A0A5C5FPY7_9BASI|nr:Alg9-like mannosyltransferase family-domain-containing protein [Rhodotorula diobovata]